MHKYRGIIADDEPNLIPYLKGMLLRLWPELEIVGMAANGSEALTLIRDEEPDVVFLDIHMPVLSGIQVANRIKGECLVIFITAYDEFAIEAFDASAMDYLLKPINEERLVSTIERLKKNLQQQGGPSEEWLQSVNEITKQLRQKDSTQYLSWIRAGDSDETKVIPVDEVIYFKSGDKYTTVACKDKEYLIRKAIKELVVELNPELFWQIHRGIVINISEIASVKKNQQGGYSLKMKESKTELSVSRRYAHLFKQM